MFWRLSVEITSETLRLTLGKITLRTLFWTLEVPVSPILNVRRAGSICFLQTQIPICQKIVGFGIY